MQSLVDRSSPVVVELVRSECRYDCIGNRYGIPKIVLLGQVFDVKDKCP